MVEYSCGLGHMFEVLTLLHACKFHMWLSNFLSWDARCLVDPDVRNLNMQRECVPAFWLMLWLKEDVYRLLGLSKREYKTVSVRHFQAVELLLIVNTSERVEYLVCFMPGIQIPQSTNSGRGVSCCCLPHPFIYFLHSSLSAPRRVVEKIPYPQLDDSYRTYIDVV